MSQNGQICNRLAPNGANRCLLPAGHDSPHRTGLLRTTWIDTVNGPEWVPVQPSQPLPVALHDGRSEPDPEHKHNYLKRTEAARNAADGEHQYKDAMAHVGAAFGMTRDETIELIAIRKQKVVDGR